MAFGAAAGSTAQIGVPRRRGAQAEVELLRRGCEPAGLVGAESVLTVQYDGEHPAGAGLPERLSGHDHRDVAGDVARRHRHRTQRPAVRGHVLRGGEVLRPRCAATMPSRRRSVVAAREWRIRRERGRAGIAHEDVEQLRTERAAERRRRSRNVVRGARPGRPESMTWKRSMSKAPSWKSPLVGYAYVPGPWSSPVGSSTSSTVVPVDEVGHDGHAARTGAAARGRRDGDEFVPNGVGTSAGTSRRGPPSSSPSWWRRPHRRRWTGRRRWRPGSVVP